MLTVNNCGWAKPQDAASYAGISKRTLNKWLADGLKHVRLNTKTILIKYSWIDEYLDKFKIVNKVDDLNQIVNSIVKGFQN